MCVENVTIYMPLLKSAMQAMRQDRTEFAQRAPPIVSDDRGWRTARVNQGIGRTRSVLSALLIPTTRSL